MVPIEGDNTGRPLGTPTGYEITMLKGRGQETIAITAEPMKMRITIDYKEENKRPVECGNHHGSINSH